MKSHPFKKFHITEFLIFACWYLLFACGTLNDIGHTIQDAADIACNVFATDHPQEFEAHARAVLPPGTFADAEKSGFDPAILCKIQEVVERFTEDQIRLQSATAAELRPD